MTDLSELVKKLTEPSFEHVFQKHDDGHGQTKTVEVASLLEQMRDRAWPARGAAGQSKEIDSTRSVGDLDAMFEYAKIAAQIANWCHVAGLLAPKDASEALQAWHRHVQAILSDEHRAWYQRHLAGWLNLIEDTLYGATPYVPRYPCPVCGGTEWGDRINGGDMWPISVRYREDSKGAAYGHRAVCRIPTCGTVWYGLDAITELGKEVDEKRHATTE